jgi:pSer/pThr/pTyr-binding forkhead associated (FHA) protein
MAFLRALQGLNAGELFPLDRASVVLGRHPLCDVVLESASVSRQHGKITSSDGNYYLQDLNSRNGTYLNGKPIAKPQLLKEGDEIGICDLAFVFHLTEPKNDVASDPLPRRTDEEKATFIDDDRSPAGSAVLTKVDLSGGSISLSPQVNTEAKLKALLEISQNLSRTLELNDVLPKLLDSLFKIFLQADRGFIVLKDPRSGRLMNPNLGEYHVPVNVDVPSLEAILVEEVDPHVNALGIKGVGEIGITGTAGAVANAVWHATGVRVRQFPITLDRLIEPRS